MTRLQEAIELRVGSWYCAWISATWTLSASSPELYSGNR